jgi:riboflavin synthase
MFTGIIQAVGRIERMEPTASDRRLAVRAPGLGLEQAQPGDSIAVNGCCLTAVRLEGDLFEADVSRETLERTTLGGLAVGDRVNLEKALTLATPLGGHLVSGHVDGIGTVVWRRPDGRSERWRFRVPAALSRYIAEKGSICVDGISLTVNGVEANEFEVNIVPHTAEVTTLAALGAGASVNLEVDLIARYLERLLNAGAEAGAETGGVTRALLERAGFIGK